MKCFSHTNPCYPCKTLFKMNSIANISLYIPHVFKRITKHRIGKTFEKLDFGEVSRVDLVVREGQRDTFHSAYVHFNYWNDSEMTRTFQNRLKNPDTPGKVVYDDPWFWIVLENKSTPTAKGRPVCIQLDADIPPKAPRKIPGKKMFDFSDLESNHFDFEESYEDLVDSKYAKLLEKELHELRNENDSHRDSLHAWRNQYEYFYHKNTVLENEVDQLKAQLREMENNCFIIQNENKHLKDDVECYKNKEWVQMV